MNVSQELAVDIGAEVSRCLDRSDYFALKSDRIMSPVVKAIRCLFAEAKLKSEVYTYGNVSASDLLYIGNNLYDVEKFMATNGLVPMSSIGKEKIIDWYERYALATDRGERTLSKLRATWCANNIQEKENAYWSSDGAGYGYS